MTVCDPVPGEIIRQGINVVLRIMPGARYGADINDEAHRKRPKDCNKGINAACSMADCKYGALREDGSIHC